MIHMNEGDDERANTTTSGRMPKANGWQLRRGYYNGTEFGHILATSAASIP